MTQSTRRMSAVIAAIALPVAGVLGSLVFLSSPGAPQLDHQQPVTITVPEPKPDDVGATQADPGDEAPPRGEVSPLNAVEFEPEPRPQPQPPNPPPQRVQPQQRPIQRPAPRPPASDDDDDDDYDDDDDDDDYDDDDDDDDD